MRRDLQSCFQAFKACFSIMIPLFISSKMMLQDPLYFQFRNPVQMGQVSLFIVPTMGQNRVPVRLQRI
jgi:hypothetical protein